MVTEKGSVGHHTLDNKALTLRHGGQEQGACVPWVAGCNCFGVGAEQPHTSPGAKLRQGEGLRGPVQRRCECETVIRQVIQIILHEVVRLLKGILKQYGFFQFCLYVTL